MTTSNTDIRLVPITAEHHAALMSTDGLQILKAVRALIVAYEKAPPLTHAQAHAYTHDLAWWNEELSDL